MFNLIVILSLFSLSIQTHAAPLAGITTRVSLASDDTQGKTIAADERCWPEMLRVHYRDGGLWWGILPVKYLIRKVVAPLISARRRFMLRGG